MASERTSSGYKPSTPDPRDYQITIDDDRLPLKPDNISTFDIFTESPQAKSWNGPYIYQSLDQGMTGTCVLNATAAAYRCAYMRAHPHALRTPEGHDEIRHFMPSRLFLYYLARLLDEDKSQWGNLKDFVNHPPTRKLDKDEGTDIRTACHIVCALGACSEPLSREPSSSLPDPGGHPVKAMPTSADVGPNVTEWPFFFLPDEPWDPKEEPRRPLGRHWVKNQEVESPLNDLSVNLEKDNKKAPKWRFPEGSLGTLPPSKGCYTSALKHRSLEYAQPAEIKENLFEMWKHLLVNGYPIIFAADLYGEKDQDGNVEDPDQDKFYPRPNKNDPSKSFVPATTGPSDGDNFVDTHVMLAVGWDEVKKAFLIQDSYGTSAYGDPLTGDLPGSGRVKGAKKYPIFARSGQGRWYMPYSWLTTKSPRRQDGSALAGEPYVLINSK